MTHGTTGRKAGVNSYAPSGASRHDRDHVRARGRAPRAGQRPAGRAQRGPLGRYANNSSPSTPVTTPDPKRAGRWSKRRERFSLRYRLRELTKLERVRKCGHVPVGNAGAGPGLRLGALDGHAVAGFTGLAHCGSVWACPVCSAKIATVRASELADLMRYALEEGCSASMVTLTMRHHAGQPLKDSWAALSAAWAAVTSGKQWVSDQASYGLVGFVKAVEITHGQHGWHVHVHALMIWKTKITQKSAKKFGDRMWLRWTRALGRKGYDSLRDSGGLDVRMASLKPGKNSGLHEYFVKLSHEITGGQAKLAKGSGRTPFQILSDVFAHGLADDVDLWHEWEAASRGRRQIAYSKGLREWAKLREEKSDEEIAADEGDGDDLLMLTGESWRSLRRSPDDVCDLLEAAERGGRAAAQQWLDLHQLDWIAAKMAEPYPAPPPGHHLNRTELLEAYAPALPHSWRTAKERAARLKAIEARRTARFAAREVVPTLF